MTTSNLKHFAITVPATPLQHIPHHHIMGHWTSITERTARRWHNTFSPAKATLVNTHTEKLDLAGHSTLPLGICNFATAVLFFFPAQNKQFTSNADVRRFTNLTIYLNLFRSFKATMRTKDKISSGYHKHVSVELQLKSWTCDYFWRFTETQKLAWKMCKFLRELTSWKVLCVFFLTTPLRPKYIKKTFYDATPIEQWKSRKNCSLVLKLNFLFR